MISLNFYRDDEYVYYNNPNGITKKMAIAEFEAIMSGDSVLPEYSSSSQGKVLSVDSDGDLECASLPPDELPAYSSSDHGEVLSVDANGDLEWGSLPPAELPAYTSSDGGKVLTVNSGGTGVEWGEGVMVVHILNEDGSVVLDKNWTEIKGALDSGKFVYLVKSTDEYSQIQFISLCEISDMDPSDVRYVVDARNIANISTPMLYTSNTATGVLYYDELS